MRLICIFYYFKVIYDLIFYFFNYISKIRQLRLEDNICLCFIFFIIFSIILVNIYWQINEKINKNCLGLVYG